MGQLDKSSTQQGSHCRSFLVALGYFFLGGLHMEKGVWPPLILAVSLEPAGYCALRAMTLVELRLFAKLHAIPDM